MEQGPFARAPLDLLFPGIGEDVVTRLRAAAAFLDAARPSGDPPKWHWTPDHAVFPGPGAVGIPVVLCTAVSMDDGPDDWTEYELDVCWTRRGSLLTTAQVGVACRCEVDHGTHYVEELALEVGNDLSLAETFERAAHQVGEWISARASSP